MSPYFVVHKKVMEDQDLMCFNGDLVSVFSFSVFA